MGLSKKLCCPNAKMAFVSAQKPRGYCTIYNAGFGSSSLLSCLGENGVEAIAK
jgi:hypothetical protein